MRFSKLRAEFVKVFYVSSACFFFSLNYCEFQISKWLSERVYFVNAIDFEAVLQLLEHFEYSGIYNFQFVVDCQLNGTN